MNTQKIFKKKNVWVIKYLIVLVFFVVWVGFFDVHNFKEQLQYRLKINELEDEKEYYLKKIKEDSLRLNELRTNDENLEKYAREKYHMKKEGEEIFLLEKKKEK